MKPVIFIYRFYPLLFLLSLHKVSTSPHKIPTLSPYNKEALNLRKSTDDYGFSSSAAKSNDFKTYYYEQTVDHFNYAPQSYAKFRQRYVVSSEHWGGPNSESPIFVYLGAEESLDSDLAAIGFLSDNAPHFKSLSLYIEHRFYGESTPFGTMEEAMKNKTTRGYFNSAQAIADYAEILLHVKKQFSAHNSPIIVVGGSYGGMLASWFRLKYPHIALGAVASSAPILYFDNITPQNGYYSVVTKDFKEVSEKCYETIKKSWGEIDRVASQDGGLSTLSQRFKTCSNLKYSWELKNFLDNIYASAAQYNAPPRYPVTVVCGGIDGAPASSDVIGRIFAGVVAYKGNKTCYNMTSLPSETSVGWGWQTCSEMVMPIGIEGNETMFEASPFDLHEFVKDCNDSYGVTPRPHWVTTYYGGHDIKLVLKRFGSNIIFSNGLRDPYSIGGVLEDLSESIVAITTRNGTSDYNHYKMIEGMCFCSHCLDILPAKESDPDWLVLQRKKEVKIVQGWLTAYYADLHSLSK